MVDGREVPVRRRPGAREWLATALCVAFAASMVNRLQSAGRIADDGTLEVLRAERETLAGYSEERLEWARMAAGGEAATFRVGPEWQQGTSGGDVCVVRSALPTTAWADVLADLRRWSVGRRLQRVVVRPDGFGWYVEARLAPMPATKRAESR